MIYDIVITPLSDEEGGGFLGFVPDLPGCMSDGESQEQALKNTKGAIKDWLKAQSDEGRELPEPGVAIAKSNAERKRLFKAIRLLAEDYDALDGRIEELDRKMSEINESLDNNHRWLRFTDISGLSAQRVRVVG